MKIEQKKNIKRPLYATGTALLASTMILSGCFVESSTYPTQRPYEEAPTTPDYYSYNVVNGCKYEFLGSWLYGPDFDRGWYIRDDGDEKAIIVCAGKDYPEGHYISATEVDTDRNDYEIVVISVEGAIAKDPVIDGTPYPCCSVGFVNKIPEKVRIHSYDGITYNFGGYIIDTEVGGLDITIDKDYTVVFQKGNNLTYVYKMEDGKYKYINAVSGRTSSQNPDMKEFVKGSGTVDSISGLERVSTLFDSFGYAIVNGDEGNTLKTAKEYIKMLTGDDV